IEWPQVEPLLLQFTIVAGRELRQKRRVRRILGAVGEQKEESWSVRRPQQLPDQTCTVTITPLCVVDAEDDAIPFIEPREQFANRKEALSAQLLWLGGDGPGGHLSQARHTTKHGGDPQQSACATRRKGRDRLVRQFAKAMREAVH